MFEQSILARTSKAKRIWAASLGVTGQVLMVGAMIVVPMLWPEVLPKAAFVTVVPHAPPGHRAHGKEEAKPHNTARALHPRPYRLGIVVPVSAPAVALRIIDEPDVPTGEAVGVIGVPGGIGIGGDGNDLVGRIISAGSALERPPAEKPRPVEVRKPEPAPIQRLAPGGRVKAPRLISRVEPRYPEIPKRAGIAGVVKLTGVIGVDGRIRELSVVSGNPLFVQAAVDAVRQWLYEPPQLNEKPIEVITEIVVTFTLNR